MDDITNKRFDRVEQGIDGVERKLDQVEQRLDQKIDAVRTELGAKLDNVARGLEATINAGMAAGFQAAAEQRRELHGETMRKFQRVIDEAERMGALAARDRRVSDLEAELTDLRDRLARVEQAVGSGRSGS